MQAPRGEFSMSPFDSLSPCRLLIDGPAAGAWNMAVDEVLLEGAGERKGASLRFYGWSEPTLSLGYFQSAAEARRHAASRGCPVVRRQTGGGAILHDQELTYCLAVPLEHPLAADSVRLYRAVHDALVSTLERFCITTTLCTASEEVGTGGQPFLCFQRRTRGDVLLGTSKVCGSAQRRRRGAVLQHGSLLLAASPRAPELPGIRELTRKNPELGPLAESWGKAIARHLRLAPVAGQLSETERQTVRVLSIQKYAAPPWNERR
jgi:lipoate-protein ligase A